ncbi:MAG: endonuclease MutS2 [Lachnospiraceae bacterium]|nr:endonuclease MutS2 [Lachnospiraceae bacterium]
MDLKTCKPLEFEKIRDMLVDEAESTAGKELCARLCPTGNIDKINKWLSETSDALTHLVTQGDVSFVNVKDIRDSLKRLEIGASLSAVELLIIARLLSNTGTVKSYFRAKTDENDCTMDSLDDYYQALNPLKNLSTEISRCIPAEDEISDDASAKLREIRMKIRSAGGRVHEALNKILQSHSQALQDNVITMRDGRYCIPVRADHRREINGLVHDQSATGSTLFIEPDSVVKLNNEIRELEIEEKKEIEKILAELSNLCSESSHEIYENFMNLQKLDFIFAKARLSRNMRGSKPIISYDGHINIKKGRHPLLNKETCVPIDIYMGEKFTTLVITGPNTGGKTVSLKTLGLFSLMGQAGLHIPAFDNSTLRCFRQIFADIGDEQSIEQSLSTFSAHMVNTVSILKKADSKSLVLFDELGAGTDPVEGAALATAILSHLHSKGIYTCATTHYSELKLYALTTAGVENASCEFDVKSLSPTYKLLIGIPGKSNAFAISRRLGLSEEIIRMADENIERDEKQFEDVIGDLEKSRSSMDKERKELAEKRREVSKLQQELKKEKEKINSSKQRILHNANREAADIISDAKKVADETIRDFQKYAKENPDIREMEEKRRKLNEEINKKNVAPEVKKPDKPVKKMKPEEIKVGMDVHVISMDSDAVVNSLPDKKGNFKVSMGILETKVNVKDVYQIKKKKVVEQPVRRNTGAGKIKANKAKNVQGEVNLIGMTTAEAIPEMDKYLDDAYLSGRATVRVVHGRGTGALRKAVQSHLKQLKYVESFRNGEFGEGDMGVTIVTFKD